MKETFRKNNADSAINSSRPLEGLRYFEVGGEVGLPAVFIATYGTHTAELPPPEGVFTRSDFFKYYFPRNGANLK
jgi:hypothetical protein